jgi:hypothetical protein
VAERLHTTGATISRREAGLSDLASADIAAYIKLFGVTYEDIYPGTTAEGPPADLTAEINRLCDELGLDIVAQMPPNSPRDMRLRVLRTATERFREAATELLRLRSKRHNCKT